MQRRIFGNAYMVAHSLLYIVTVLFLGSGIYCDYMYFKKEAAEWLTEGGILIFLAGTGAIIFYNLLTVGFLWFSIASIPSFFGKIQIDESGVRATAFSRTIFQATWEELVDVGIVLSCTLQPTSVNVAILYFSKYQLNLLTKGELYALSKLHVDSEHALIWDFTENVLKSGLMQHIPPERLVWYQDDGYPTEMFLKWKFALTRQKEE